MEFSDCGPFPGQLGRWVFGAGDRRRDRKILGLPEGLDQGVGLFGAQATLLACEEMTRMREPIAGHARIGIACSGNGRDLHQHPFEAASSLARDLLEEFDVGPLIQACGTASVRRQDRIFAGGIGREGNLSKKSSAEIGFPP